jgi:aminoglycoside 3-N-acetyltransferase
MHNRAPLCENPATVNRSRVRHSELTKVFLDLGIDAGSRLIVHSSLSSFGFVEGGASGVIDALLEVIGPDGLLLMPSFNHGRPFEDGGPGHYDPRATATTNGRIPDVFWRRQDVARTLNPTHAFAAWGPDAERYTADHHRTLTMGPDSPLGTLQRQGGYGLLLGVGYNRNTFHHVVEMTTKAPCLGRRTEAYPVRIAGRRVVLGRTWGWRGGRCPFTDQTRYGSLMEDRGLQSAARIGDGKALFFSLADCFGVVEELLSGGGFGFPPCGKCPIRPRHTIWTVESDWDEELDRLKPDSEAWSY